MERIERVLEDERRKKVEEAEGRSGPVAAEVGASAPNPLSKMSPIKMCHQYSRKHWCRRGNRCAFQHEAGRTELGVRRMRRHIEEKIEAAKTSVTEVEIEEEIIGSCTRALEQAQMLVDINEKYEIFEAAIGDYASCRTAVADEAEEAQ